jgi:hypothetical protein
MPHVNQTPQDDSDAGRRAYERRYLRALEGWVASRMRSQALKRRKAGSRPRPGRSTSGTTSKHPASDDRPLQRVSAQMRRRLGSAVDLHKQP